MVGGSITKDGLSKSKVDPCGVCSLRVKAISVLCVDCGKWIHSRCAGVKMMLAIFSRNFACRKCDWKSGEAVEHEEGLCDDVETVKGFMSLSDRVSVGGRCETAVTART